MTKRQEWWRHGSCVPTRDGGRWWRVWRQKGDSGRKRNSVYWEKERLKDIDVGRQERDEQRQLTMERTLLALKREGGGGLGNGAGEWWEPERGFKVTEGRERAVGAKEAHESKREKQRSWNPMRLWSLLLRGSCLMLWEDEQETRWLEQTRWFLYRWGGLHESKEAEAWVISLFVRCWVGVDADGREWDGWWVREAPLYAQTKRQEAL